jgi:hypothetical protein
MTLLNSSAIYAVDYDGSTGELIIYFRSSGRGYTFSGVPAQVAYGLMRADSPGTYYNIHIRGYYN